MSRHRADLAVIERTRFLRLERQNRAREEDGALEARFAETIALSALRGEELERAPQHRGEARKPVRRLTGLTWLHRKSRITDDQWAAGERYGAVYRKAKGEAAIASILNDGRGTGDGQTIASIMANSEKVAHAASVLTKYRRELSNVQSLIAACDKVCGEELTPREASVDGHQAAQLEAVLLVALDLLVSNHVRA